jgi:cytochrome c5
MRAELSPHLHEGFIRRREFSRAGTHIMEAEEFMRRIPARALVAGLTVVALAACEKAPPAPPAMQAPQSVASPLSHSDQLLLAAASVALPPAGIQPGDLPDPNARGAQLLATYCAQCHALPAPSAHSTTDWPGVTRRMWLRMDELPESLGVKVPTTAERYELLKYLTVNALKVSGSTLPAGHGREAYSLVCSRCHALPDVRVHSKEDWPVVFARMERNMERMKVRPPTAKQTEDILSYLKTASPAKRAAHSRGD